MRMQLPEPVGWMTAFRTKDGRGGLFIRLKGDEGETLYSEFQTAKASLEAELGSPFSLNVEKTDPFDGRLSIDFEGNSRDDGAFGAWLNETANKATSVFRPFLAQVS